MNHIYKVIWSRVKNSYVVVSEIAGTARKSGRVRVSKNTLAAVLAAFLLTGLTEIPVNKKAAKVLQQLRKAQVRTCSGERLDLRVRHAEHRQARLGHPCHGPQPCPGQR